MRAAERHEAIYAGSPKAQQVHSGQPATGRVSQQGYGRPLAWLPAWPSRRHPPGSSTCTALLLQVRQVRGGWELGFRAPEELSAAGSMDDTTQLSAKLDSPRLTGLAVQTHAEAALVPVHHESRTKTQKQFC